MKMKTLHGKGLVLYVTLLDHVISYGQLDTDFGNLTLEMYICIAYVGICAKGV